MQTLELEPWEMPPGSLAARCARADLEIELWGALCPLRLVRLSPARWVMFVRYDGRNFLVLNPQTRAPQIWRVKPTDWKLRRVVARLHFSSWFGMASLLVWSELEGGPLVAITEHHRWHQDQEHARWQATWLDLDLTQALRFRLKHEGDVREQLKREWNTPNSYARFAWEWKQVSSEQKAAMWQQQQRRLEEMQGLMRWVLWCLPEVWEEADELNLFYTAHEVTSSWFSNWKDRVRHPILTEGHSILVANWGAELQRRFVPLHHIALLELNPDIGFSAEKYPPAVVAPTMHEKLEARLKLREWLEENAPDKIEALLPS